MQIHIQQRCPTSNPGQQLGLTYSGLGLIPWQETDRATEGLTLPSLDKWEGCFRKGIWPKACAKSNIRGSVCLIWQPQTEASQRTTESLCIVYIYQQMI